MALQSLLIPIVSAFKSAGITQAKAAMGGLGRTFNSLAKNIGAAAGSLAAFQGLAGSREFILESIDATQRLERNLIALNQVYGNLGPQLERFGKAVQDYGISQNQAAQASIFIGSVLKQYGFNVGEAADATQRIVKLSQDLATTYGYDVQEALLAVTALFRGEFDPIEKFGVAMKQNEINAELAARGLDNLEGAARENAEAQITLDFLFTRAADSVGAFARATDTLYAAQKRLQAVTANLQAAFGAPFQQPLAEINNIVAELVEDNFDELVDLGEALGEALEKSIPFIESAATFLIELTTALKPLIELASTLGNGLLNVLKPALDAVNEALDAGSLLLEKFVARGELFELQMKRNASAAQDFFDWISEERYDNVIIPGIIKGLEDLDNALRESTQRDIEQLRALTGDFEGFDAGVKAASTSLRGQALTSRDAAEAAKETARQVNALNEALRGAATDARDAEGNLVGLAAVFDEIDSAARKSKAEDALKEIGISAALIEQVLTQPNWEEIFNRISRLAYLTAIDISKVMSVTALGAIYGEIEKIQEELKDLFTVEDADGTTATAAKNYVKEFFDNIEDEVFKQKARVKMFARGLPEPLIESILGNEDWLKVWIKILQSGEEGIKDLIDSWSETAEGIAFATKEAEAFAAEAQRIADIVAGIRSILSALVPEEDVGRFEGNVKKVLSGLRDQIESLEADGLISESNAERLRGWVLAYEGILLDVARKRDAVAGLIADASAKLEATKKLFLTPSDVASIVQPVALVERSVSKFEQQVATSVAAIRSKIKEGADQSLIGLGVVKELNALADATHVALMSIARDREALSAQYDQLVRKQNDARLFRSATQEAIQNYADVTQILRTATQQLADATGDSVKSTTEIIAQTIKSARNFRDYRVVLVRDFIEPTAKAAAQASSITDGLRKVLEDTRLFATNLAKLRELGLDPALFKQIVDSGMEAGNATAEAIIDGGPETVSEINSLYKEIEEVGKQAADLATETLFDGGEDMIQGVIDGILAKDQELADEAAAIAQNLVDAFQGKIDEHVVKLDNFIEQLEEYEEELIELGKKLGESFAEAFAEQVGNALKGIDVEMPVAPDVEVPETPELAPVLDTEAIARIQQRIDDITSIINSIMSVYVPDTDPASAAAFEKDLQALRDERTDLMKELFKLQPVDGGTVINLNVKTDSTQSTAQVGRTISQTINKYTNTGGKLVTQ